jgi:SNF2 family DNA or RNA helicase
MMLALLLVDKNRSQSTKARAHDEVGKTNPQKELKKKLLRTSSTGGGEHAVQVKGGTLVICPLTLIQHWYDELTLHTQPSSSPVTVTAESIRVNHSCSDDNGKNEMNDDNDDDDDDDDDNDDEEEEEYITCGDAVETTIANKRISSRLASKRKNGDRQHPMSKRKLLVGASQSSTSNSTSASTITSPDGGSLSVYMYYGSDRKMKHDLSKYDVVITSYGTLSSEYTSNITSSGNPFMTSSSSSSSSSSPLFSTHWNRIVLDEAHNIKNCTTVMARAAMQLKATKRW